jgi:hypothetical protein
LAERIEARLLAGRRLIEIRAIAEVLADEARGPVEIARRDRVAVHRHHIDVGGFEQRVDLLEITIGRVP